MLKVEIQGLNELAELLNAISDFGLVEEKQSALAARIAVVVQAEWREVLTARRSEVGLKRPQYGFAKGIRIKSVNQYNYKVVSESPYSKWMQEAESDFDMKKTHPYGKKSRVSKKGVPYLIVPFMHNQPGAADGMPSTVFGDLKKAVKKSGFSFVLKSRSHTQANAKGEQIFRSSYQWGGRTGKYEGDFSRYSGMVMMDRSFVNAAGQSRRESKAFTFRVISAKSPSGSWIRKARPTVIPYVVNKVRGEIESLADSVLFGE